MKKKILAVAIMGLFASSAAMAGTIGTVNDGQLSIGNQTTNVQVKNKAKAGKGNLNHASGNIGVNVSAGTGNQQTNATALAVSSHGYVAASVDADQAGVFNFTESIDSKNKASGGKGVLNHAAGNIGVNIAAGNNNQQQNNLAMATRQGDDESDPTASVTSQQVSAINGTLTGGYFWDNGTENKATGGKGVLNHAKGNIGVNIAAGTGNQQANSTALANGGGDFVGATIFTNQASVDNMVEDVGILNTADGGEHVLKGAKGNIGVNIAAGVGNQQQNNLALAKSDNGAYFADATVLASQGAVINGALRGMTANNANGGYDVLNDATGNIGVNIAAGEGNQQANSLALAMQSGNGHDRDPAATIINNQVVGGNGALTMGGDNSASGGYDVLNDASGNIGVNIAAGAGNQQANVTAIAVADATHVKAASGLKQKSKHNETFNGGGETGANLGFGNLNDASGNISVNIAAGTGNQQANSLDIARNASDEDDLKVRARTGAVQRSAHNTTTNFFHNNEADPGVDNLNGASGNISVNIAAGTGNQQANQLALATGTRSDEEKWGTDAHLKAKVADKQVSRENKVYNQYTSNAASSGTDNLNDASGNISVNIAAGNGNQQANGVAIAAGDLVHAKASTEATQESLGNTVGLAPEDGYVFEGQYDENRAVGGEGSLNHASGNISVNVTAGNGNQQKNDLALAAYTGPEADTTALANVVASQIASGNMADNANLTNTATLGTGMLNHATGNISVNVSAGSFNQQANLLSISNAK